MNIEHEIRIRIEKFFAKTKNVNETTEAKTRSHLEMNKVLLYLKLYHN